MTPPDSKRELMLMIDECFEHKTGPIGWCLLRIDKILVSYPEELSLFVEMFEQDRYPNDTDRETLAYIILPRLAHSGVIAFLRERKNWADSEINEFAEKKVLNPSMILPHLKRELLRMIEFLFVTQDDLFEGPLAVVDDILKLYPEEVSLFVDLFEQDQYPNDADRETLAYIILPHLTHPGVIEFLRNHDDWTDEEINEIAGKKVL